jgi:glycerol-3-phosphate acyltransferase PlsY
VGGRGMKGGKRAGSAVKWRAPCSCGCHWRRACHLWQGRSAGDEESAAPTPGLFLMSLWLAICIPVVLAYVVGATPFGWLAGRLRGIDLREHGSGNIGATNAVRVLGKGLGLPVFALDFFKGLLPVMGAGWHVSSEPVLSGHPMAGQVVPVLTGMAAVLGHTYTFWLGFRGGKGVATSAGVMMGLAPLALMAAVMVWALAMKVCRYVSLSSILAGWTAPLVVAAIGWWRDSLNVSILGLAFLIAVLVTVRHRDNIARIAAGTEPKAGRRKPDPSPP